MGASLSARPSGHLILLRPDLNLDVASGFQVRFLGGTLRCTALPTAKNRIQIRFFTQIHPSHPPDIPFPLHSVGPPPYIRMSSHGGYGPRAPPTELHRPLKRRLRPPQKQPTPSSTPPTAHDRNPMTASHRAWVDVTTSGFDHERAALNFIRQRFSTRSPFRAWSNFTFMADDGTLNEVDLLVVSPTGVYLVEIKSYPGRLGGDAGTWRWTHPDTGRTSGAGRVAHARVEHSDAEQVRFRRDGVGCDGALVLGPPTITLADQAHAKAFDAVLGHLSAENDCGLRWLHSRGPSGERVMVAVADEGRDARVVQAFKPVDEGELGAERPLGPVEDVSGHDQEVRLLVQAELDEILPRLESRPAQGNGHRRLPLGGGADPLKWRIQVEIRSMHEFHGFFPSNPIVEGFLEDRFAHS